MSRFQDLADAGIPITSGWVPVAIVVIALAATVWLVAVFRRRYAIAIAAAAGCAAVTYLSTNSVLVGLSILPEPIPRATRAWIALGVFAVVLLVPRLLASSTAGARVVTVCATIAVVAASANGVNREFDAYPTVESLFDTGDVDEATQGEFGPDGVKIVDLSEWHPTTSLPSSGRVASMPIPATASGFQARPAIVYFPPAYSANPRPRLPVLVLLAGQPGSPSDWIRSVRMPSIMDAFAKDHGGVAPVVVVADGTGTEWDNPACVDSPEGNVSTYLTTDLQNWAARELTVATDRAHWAVGGLSYGGTCSLQLVTNHPNSYRVFLNMSGQLEPTLGGRQRTVDTLFGGSVEAFRKVNPMDIMARQKFPNVTGVFVVGADDRDYRPGLERVYAAARASGMRVEMKIIPGGHTFAVWRTGLQQELPWLAAQLGIK
ncbi:hypothetical protein ACH46_05545 [Gordonia phthalatica]|uniref:Esterase n=1 Tax=Gordonia phthalatica TaxID=1136941 RepID=A0A0N9MTX8_9ACTN|nr:hypothetical protein ACH46_05545 [Gordonia phthalatica]